MAVIETERWYLQAACNGPNQEFFYPPIETGERDQDRAKREVMAKRICASCVVRFECLDFATRTEQTLGIWGSYTESERRNSESTLNKFLAAE